LTALALSCLCRRGLTLSSLPQGQCSTGYVSVTASLLAKPCRVQVQLVQLFNHRRLGHLGSTRAVCKADFNKL
uniref:Secreted protein n=1 Tax=Macrostomum lignano TaxID=282301 RepID=A0A1I8HFU9_9PLAT